MTGAERPGDGDEPTGVSRRTLFRAGAGVAGAAVVSTVGGVPAAFAAPTKPRTNQNGNGAGQSKVQGLAGARSAASTPPLLAGATVAQRGWANFRVSATSPDPLPITLYETFGLVFDANGPAGSFIETELDLPTGSMLARIDVYGATTAADAQHWTVFRQTIGHPGDPLEAFGDIPTDQGPGTVHGVGDYTAAPKLIRAGEIVNVALQDSSADSAANGVIYQYYPAGAIKLITPVRVYDSRAGNPPAVGPKTRLPANTPRSVDCSFGGAVPPGAKGVLVNVTAVDTGPAGWLVVYRNGIATPFVSTVNWTTAGTTVANSAIVDVDGAAKIAAFTNTSTDFLIDVLGYLP